MKKTKEKITLTIFIKTVVTWALVGLLLAAQYLLFMPPVLIYTILFDRKNKKAIFLVTKLFIKVFFFLYFTAKFNIDLRGIKQSDNPRIYMFNHASQFDTFLMYLMPDFFKVFVKSYYVNYPFIGWTIKLSGNILVNKPKNTNLESDLILKGIQAIKNGNQLIIFPEGTKSKTGSITRFKTGGFKIAYETQAEIVPVVLDTWNAIRPGNGGWIRDDQIWVKVLESYQYNDYKDIDIKEFSKALRHKMNIELYQIREKRRKTEKKYYRNIPQYKELDEQDYQKSLQYLKYHKNN